MTHEEYIKIRSMYAGDGEEAESLTPETGERFWEVVNDGFGVNPRTRPEDNELNSFIQRAVAIVLGDA